jgi:hypothetical protein
MHTLARGFILVCALVAVGVGSPALAAPDRLDEGVPSAFPDTPEAWALSYGHETINLEGALTSSSTAHDYFKLRYTFSPKVAASVRYTLHDLNNGFALINPILDNQDSGSSYEVDLRTNLLNVAQVPADPAKNQVFAAGSAFSMGVSGTFFQLDAGNLGRNESLIKAYLAYTTDLTEEMTAHTYFSSGRLSGDNSSGSVNRIGAGVDYVLIPGDNQLTLMADGILDIYNFREPSFNTSRVSQFDVGLRYRVSRDWYASLGWITVNDSENDASGSGIFAGLNYVQEPKPPVECPPAAAPAEGAPADGAAPAAAAAPAPQVTAQAPTPQPAKQAASTSAGDVPALMAGGGYSGSVNREASADPSTADTAASNSEPRTIASRSVSSADTEPSPLVDQVSQYEPGPVVLEQDEAAVSGGPYYYDPQRAELNEQASTALDAPTPAEAGTDVTPDAEAPATGEPELQPVAPDAASAEEPGGISIPPFPRVLPRHTPLHAIMIRAGLALPLEVPQATRPEQQMSRAPLAGEDTPTAELTQAADEVDEALEQAITEDTYAGADSGKSQA